MPIFVVTLEGAEPPQDQRLTVLAFIRADDAGGAEKGALAAMAERRWSDVRALRSGEITDEAAVPADFARAMDSARQVGLGLIIYDET